MSQFVSTDFTRTQFSRAMSAMYATEVPAYSTLLELVSGINETTLSEQPELKHQLEDSDNLARITEERHGAIRIGKPEELHTMRRLFAVMGMFPVSYYDLSVAGIPVHSTAFRPVERKHLSANPFRVFTSLLRLDLIDDKALQADAEAILAKRDIFTEGAKTLIAEFEKNGGLTEEQSAQFVKEALETFRWHSEATVTASMYKRLHDAHRLIADVVSFKGPHINHLTPRTLDIDAVQVGMPKVGINPKLVVEGPPPRKCQILLRQTSFKALEESVNFIDEATGEASAGGTHTARFGEIEQRGVALTKKGRELYDELLLKARERANNDEQISYETALAKEFSAFPDDWATLHREKLAFFEYQLVSSEADKNADLDSMIERGHVRLLPIVYEDFLPVSAAGIFQSNLGDEGGQNFAANANQSAFEKALGAKVADEFELYAELQASSRKALYEQLAS